MTIILDITINGSIVGQGEGYRVAYARWEAFVNAKDISRNNPTRLVRIHDVDGESVIAEFRNGKQVQP